MLQVEIVFVQTGALNAVAHRQPTSALACEPLNSAAAKAIAAMNGRDFVTPDDVKYVAHPVLNHRIMLTAEREMAGVETEDIIREMTERLEVPR